MDQVEPQSKPLHENAPSELPKSTFPTEDVLNAYVNCVNSIDDYFEYMHDSEADKTAVRERLNKLRLDVAELNGGKTNATYNSKR